MISREVDFVARKWQREGEVGLGVSWEDASLWDFVSALIRIVYLESKLAISESLKVED